MNDKVKLLKILCDAQGVTGFEKPIARVIQSQLEQVSDEITYDRIGSIICRKTGKEGGLRLMIVAHMDEVGYMVDHIYPEGYIGYHYVGGWDPCQQLGMRVIIHTKSGDIPGAIAVANRTSNDWGKPLSQNDLYMDIGASDAQEVKALGVKIGDHISADYQLIALKSKNRIMAKAFDCRAGVGAMIEAVKAVGKHENSIYAVGTVQEEVGCRGAKTSAAVVNPDICIALDTAGSGDLLGAVQKSADRGLGKGPIIVVMDRAMIAHVGLFNWVTALAEELDIPHQVIYLDGGSFDTSVVHLHNIGVPSIAIAVPTRYVHTTNSIIDTEDYENTIRLVTAIAERLDQKALEKILEQ